MNVSSIDISAQSYIDNTNMDEILYPTIKPYMEGYLKVSDIHTLWYAQYGNADGIPVIVLHGGPGFGCGINDMRFFDPKVYRIILLDQRGAKRSKPYAETRENTTQALIADLEKLRIQLNINKWLIFGGSWGSSLGLLYGEAYPEHCLGFILRGIFLARQQDINQLWYGMQDTFPDHWQELQNFLPPNERADLASAYYKRLMSEDPNINLPAARAFMKYDLNCAFLRHEAKLVNNLLADDNFTLGVARLFNYYGKHNFFINENQILDNLDKVKHLPLRIVHGRYDTICRASTAYLLQSQWPGSHLVFVQDAGHSAMELGIAKELRAATDSLKLAIAAEQNLN